MFDINIFDLFGDLNLLKKQTQIAYDALDVYVKNAIKHHNSNNDKDSLFDQFYIATLQMYGNDELNEIEYQMFLSDIFVMFIAGTDTTAFNNECAILYLAKYPQMQNDLYNELIEQPMIYTIE